jgi:hypothetical protein
MLITNERVIAGGVAHRRRQPWRNFASSDIGDDSNDTQKCHSHRFWLKTSENSNDFAENRNLAGKQGVLKPVFRPFSDFRR